MGLKVKNQFALQLASSLGTGDTTIPLQAGQGDLYCPEVAADSNDYFFVTAVDKNGNREIIKIIMRASGSDTLVVGSSVSDQPGGNVSGRAQESTTALAITYTDAHVIELRMTAAMFQDIVDRTTVGYDFLPVEWGLDTATPPDYVETITSGGNSVRVRKFAGDTADESIQLPWQAPYDLYGAVVKFRVIYYITEATEPSAEGVVFGLKGRAGALGDAMGDAVVVADTGLSNSRYDRVVTDWSDDVTITGLEAGATAIFTLYRDQDHASDTYEQDVGVFGIQLRYSRSEL